MIIVGSKALSHHFPSLERDTKDIDVIGGKSDMQYLIDTLRPKNVISNDNITTLLNIENKFGIWNTNNVEILNSDNSESLTKYLDYDRKSGLDYASPEVIFSLKKSHIHFPIKFDKHIKDYCFLYDYFNGVDKLSNITTLNFKETENRIGKLKTPSLRKSTKDFFGQSDGYVKSYFIHDDIHRVMSHYDSPLYERMQKDKTFAICEKDMWEKFTFEDKCKCVLEEGYVISLERMIIPSIFGGYKWVSSEDALNWSLMRICTTLCSGWFRQFATDNYFRIHEYINKDYVDVFLTSIENGRIKKNIDIR